MFRGASEARPRAQLAWIQPKTDAASGYVEALCLSLCIQKGRKSDNCAELSAVFFWL